MTMDHTIQHADKAACHVSDAINKLRDLRSYLLAYYSSEGSRIPEVQLIVALLLTNLSGAINLIESADCELEAIWDKPPTSPPEGEL